MKRLPYSLGERYGRLTVTRDLGTVRAYGVAARRLECTCDCGGIRTVWASHLRAGSVKSCCETCNTAKQNLDLPAFFEWVQRVYEHSVEKKSGQENVVRIVF